MEDIDVDVNDPEIILILKQTGIQAIVDVLKSIFSEKSEKTEESDKES